MIQATTNDVIGSDKKELLELLTEFKEEVTKMFIDDVLQVEKIIDEFLIDDYLEGKPIVPMTDEIVKTLERIKMLTGDIKSNRHSVHFILTRFDDVQDKEDMLFILKQLAVEELLSPEQLELEEMDLPTIAVVIKDTKVGQVSSANIK